ncbi:MAG: outer membrane beta-barrel family protein, partial [Cyclobacteriaceae bacterium]|nr:outer membrane beta-barrel family protein [Cyclobacteriaceae bacterium]
SLVANLGSTVGNDKENTDITTEPRSEDDLPLGDSYLQRTHTYEKTNLSSMAVDYAQPFTDRGTLETGYKGIFRFLNADFERASFEDGDFVTDPLNSGVFDFREQIHAVYTQYTGWTGQKEEPAWKYTFGLRAEQVWNDGKTLDESQAFSNSYFNLYPSANIFYYTPARNNFKLSYSRRINRPGLGQLNPFIDITDSLNQHGGNPGLKPELIHSMELGYYHALQKVSLSMIAFYRIRRDAILPYTVLDSNGVAFSQPLNFGNATTLGIEAIATYNPLSNWSLNFSFSAYEIHIDNDGSAADVSTHQLSWYSKLINNFTLFKNLKLQVIGSYTSPTAIPQGRTVAVYYVDLGLQQEIMKGKGRLGLTVTDIFNTQQYGAVTSDYNFTFSRKAKLDTRAVMLTFGYTLGTSFKENMMENKFKNE